MGVTFSMLQRSRKFVASSAIVLLGGCFSGRDIGDTIRGVYIGRNADAFFSSNGPPISRYRLTDGTVLYTWSSGQMNIPVPATTVTTGQVDSTGSFTAVSDTVGGGFMHLECRLRITADSQNRIQDITIESDTLGKWHLSRCRELFD